MQPPPIGRALLSLSPSEASIPSARNLSGTALASPFAQAPLEPVRGLLKELHGVLGAFRTTMEGLQELPLWPAAYLTIQKHAKQHSLRFRTVLTDQTAELELAADAATLCSTLLPERSPLVTVRASGSLAVGAGRQLRGRLYALHAALGDVEADQVRPTGV